MTNFNDIISSLDKKIMEKYGQAPRRPEHLTVSVVEQCVGRLSDTPPERKLDFSLEYPKAVGHITAYSVLPENTEAQVLVAIGIHGALSDTAIPTRELVERGFGILYIPAESVSSLNGMLRQSADKAILPSRRGKFTAGKISLYAFALTLAREYLSRLGYTRLCAFGYGPTAEAALLAAVRDNAFSLVIADSPYLTERSSPFLPEDFYSLAYLEEPEGRTVNLFEAIYPRPVILGLYELSVPDERDLILDMLAEACFLDKGKFDALLLGDERRISGHGYRVLAASDTIGLTPDTALRYLDEVKGCIPADASRVPSLV
jgi:hypothetical protein